MPESLIGTIKGELNQLQGEHRTGRVRIEYWVVGGKAVEAQIRGRETLTIVALSS